MNGLPFKILIVDDDADDRLIIDEAFKDIGYVTEVKKFKSGPSLMNYLDQIDSSAYPSVIVLDNVIEGMNASDILKLVKGNSPFASIPVIINSTLLSPHMQQELMDKGACAVVEKGSVMEEIRKFAANLRDFAEASNVK